MIIGSAPPDPNLSTRFGLRLPSRDDTSIHDALSDMSLPKSLTEPFFELFERSGLALERAAVVDRFDESVVRHYTMVSGASVQFGLFHLPAWLLDGSSALGTFDMCVYRLRPLGGRIISEGKDGAFLPWEKVLREWSALGNPAVWKFVGWNNIQAAFAKKLSIDDTFEIGKSAAAAAAHREPAPTSNGYDARVLQLAPDDLTTIVNILSREMQQLSTAADKLLSAAEVPPKVSAKITSGFKDDPEVDARRVVEILISANRYPHLHRWRGDTYLGRILVELLEYVGNPDDEHISRIVINNSLMQDGAVLETLRAKLPQE